jgi:hypothetical protein
LSPELWVPGAAEPSLDGFVARIHRQIEQYTATHAADRSHVEVELADGERLTCVALERARLRLPDARARGEQLIVPVGSIRRITLGPRTKTEGPAFALRRRKRAGTRRIGSDP